LAKLVLSANGRVLTLDINEDPYVLFPSEELHRIGQKYRK